MYVACSAAACHSVRYITAASVHWWPRGIHSLEMSQTLLVSVTSATDSGVVHSNVYRNNSKIHATTFAMGSGAYFQPLQGGQRNDQNGGSEGREAALQQEGQQHAEVGQQVAAELQHCDDLLADAGLLPAQLLHLHNTLGLSITL